MLGPRLFIFIVEEDGLEHVVLLGPGLVELVLEVGAVKAHLLWKRQLMLFSRLFTVHRAWQQSETHQEARVAGSLLDEVHPGDQLWNQSCMCQRGEKAALRLWR